MLKKVNSIELNDNGKIVYNLCSNAADADPIRSGRLLSKGDKKSLEQLEELKDTSLYMEVKQ